MKKNLLLSIGLILVHLPICLFAQNVGIGVASPQEKLHIDGFLRGNQSGAVRISTGNGYVDIGPKNTSWSHFETDRSRYYFNKGITVDQGLVGSYSQDLQLQTSGTTRITALNSNGNVGIGVASPNKKLQVLNAGDSGSFTHTNWQFGSGKSGAGEVLIGTYSDQPAIQGHGSGTAYRLLLNPTNGNVGVGTTNPSEKLDVNGNTIIRGSISAEDNKTILHPKGGYRYDGTGSHSKYIVIWLPDNSSIRSMMNIKAKFYKYSNDQAAEIIMSGYTYPPNPSWINTSFSCEGYNNINEADFIVSNTGRFGIVLTNKGSVVPLGYSHFLIESVDLGYGPSYYDDLKEGWDVQFASTYPAHSSKVTRGSLFQAAGDLRIGNLGSGVLSSDASGNITSGNINWSNISGIPGDKWTGNNNTTDAISRTGNVGIGASPAYRLDVKGDIYADGGWLRVSGNQGLYFQSHGGGWYMSDGTWIRTYNGKSIYQNTGTLRTDGTFQVGSSGSTLNVPNGGNFAYRTNVLYANTAGRVGIGTTSIPSDVALEVNGAIGTSRMGIGGTYSSSQVQGIWSIAPNYKISTANNDFGNQYGLVYGWQATSTGSNKTPIAGWGHQIMLTSNGVRNIALSMSSGNAYFAGNVGVGLTNPSYKLHVNGRIRSNGINETSDIRFKKDIQPLESSLDKLLQLQGVSYYWKQDEFPDRDFEDGKDIGVIAQQVEEVFPELVHTDNEGYKSVEYSHLVPVLIEAIKELKAEKDQEVAALQSEVEVYKTLLENIDLDKLQKDYSKSKSYSALVEDCKNSGL